MESPGQGKWGEHLVRQGIHRARPSAPGGAADVVEQGRAHGVGHGNIRQGGQARQGDWWQGILKEGQAMGRRDKQGGETARFDGAVA